MSIEILIEIFLEIVVMMAFGAFFYKRNIIDENLKQGLGNLLIRGILPISVLKSSQLKFSMEIVEGMLITAVFSALFYFLSLLIFNRIAKKMEMDDSNHKIFVLLNVFANIGFIGMPLADALFGAEGLLFAVVYNLVFQIFLAVYVIPLLEGKGEDNFIEKLKNPLVYVSVAAIVLFVLPFRFPLFITNSLNYISGMMVPVSMFVIGANLTKENPKELFKDKMAYVISLQRLVVAPLILMFILKLLKIEAVTANCLVLMTALPCASFIVILAEKYHCEEAFASRTVILSTFLMIVTAPLVMMISKFVIG